MTITFKEVGQGDSIILEWHEEETPKVAIIDCNLKSDGTNPVLIHLSSTTITHIDFILISHPHYDHFSGINDVLNYCEKKNIKINCILHTSFTKPEYLRASVIGNVASSSLDILLKNIMRLRKLDVISEIGYVTNFAREFVLEKKWKLKFISPSDSEISKFNATVNKNVTASIPSFFDADANLLSTLIKIYDDSSYILLTSDVVKNVFRRLHRKGMQEFRSKIILGQLPHHGAENNYYGTFWKQLNNDPGAPIAISVGDNSYGHPSTNAINDLVSSQYKIFLTNYNKVAPTAVSYLNLISKPASKTTMAISKDWVFDTKMNTIK